jgi:hypothetical protein
VSGSSNGDEVGDEAATERRRGEASPLVGRRLAERLARRWSRATTSPDLATARRTHRTCPARQAMRKPRKRPFKLKAWEPAEDELHRSVAQWLDWMLLPPALYTTFPAGWGKMDPATAGRLRRSGLKPGFPDILAFRPLSDGMGRCIGIELKTEDGPLKQSQKEMFPLLKAAGVDVYICRSVEEVVQTLVEQGFPMRKTIEMKVA